MASYHTYWTFSTTSTLKFYSPNWVLKCSLFTTQQKTLSLSPSLSLSLSLCPSGPSVHCEWGVDCCAQLRPQLARLAGLLTVTPRALVWETGRSGPAWSRSYREEAETLSWTLEFSHNTRTFSTAAAACIFVVFVLCMAQHLQKVAEDFVKGQVFSVDCHSIVWPYLRDPFIISSKVPYFISPCLVSAITTWLMALSLLQGTGVDSKNLLLGALMLCSMA